MKIKLINCLFFLHFWGSICFAGASDQTKCETDSSLSNEIKKIEDIINNNDHDGSGRDKRSTKVFDKLLRTTLFNTTMNFIVPGAKIHLPKHTEEGSVDHLAMQAFFGIFWATAWLAIISVPVFKTHFQPLGLKRSMDDDEHHGLDFKWKLDEKVAEAIGLNWRSCAQKSICQAHEYPDKYGVLGILVQILFPADDDKLNDSNQQHTHITRSFHEAAINGAIGQECDHIYKCFFDVLDVILYVKNHCFTTLSNGY